MHRVKTQHKVLRVKTQYRVQCSGRRNEEANIHSLLKPIHPVTNSVKSKVWGESEILVRVLCLHRREDTERRVEDGGELVLSEVPGLVGD